MSTLSDVGRSDFVANSFKKQVTLDDGHRAAVIRFIGFIVMSLIAAYRLFVQVVSWGRLRWRGEYSAQLLRYESTGYAVLPRLLFHAFMFVSFVLEIPQYAAWLFFQNDGPHKDYWVSLYPCHMIAFVAFFLAFTIVINEWHNVAQPVDPTAVRSNSFESPQVRSRRRYQYSMIMINASVIIAAIILLVRIFVGDVGDLNDSHWYVAFIITVMLAQIILAMLTIIFGLRLRARINSVVGSSYGSHKFQVMVCRLISMMSLCFACFLLRFAVITMNTFHSNWGAGQKSRIFALYLSLDSWIPTWIPGLALLFLMRQTAEQRLRTSQGRSTPVKNRGRDDFAHGVGYGKMAEDGVEDGESREVVNYGALR